VRCRGSISIEFLLALALLSAAIGIFTAVEIGLLAESRGLQESYGEKNSGKVCGYGEKVAYSNSLGEIMVDGECDVALVKGARHYGGFVDSVD